ncbi:preprotein translocase subunit SecE [Methylobacterium frigidaeris]|uniref:Protein translocase subunit SecE n=1 Tax=Methylobacterium frigidaeris TaxID=2038277 RepID=A0AA37H9P2_9HYPH|nr:preprotein translocase subunit SecE [Methylobacterium frigidaeris]PIK71257.1 preprotein translocase subunit SecE [Methylobacterium frigidaeris]GJD61446.1 Protein translocase subunit SecE [Methylobacterium frigidaeris]
MASNEATKKMDLGRNASRSTPPTRGGGSTPTPPVRPVQKRVGPFEFLQQVRDEGRKVTWPTRKETLVTTLMVFVMVVVASVFFTVVDQVLRYAVTLVLGIGA